MSYQEKSQGLFLGFTREPRRGEAVHEYEFPCMGGIYPYRNSFDYYIYVALADISTGKKVKGTNELASEEEIANFVSFSSFQRFFTYKTT